MSRENTETRRDGMSSVVLDRSISLCPECFRDIPCTYEEEDGRVVQAKECPEHGAFRSLYWDDVEHYHWMRSMAPDCGDDTACCDPAGDDGRRKCLAIVDVTENCNLACSYCFASSRPGLPDVPVETIRKRLETVLEHSGPTPIQFSGGEPTIRDDLPELVAMAHAMGFEHIEVNSNGIRLADDADLAHRLRDAGATTVYLQFDGLSETAHKQLRHQDLRAKKQGAIDACRAAGLQVILVPTVVRGTNEHELGDIVRFGLKNLDVVRGINIQPVSHFGRAKEDAGHLSLPAIAKLLEEQTGFLRAKDLLQVPCCSPACSSATMLLKLPGGKAMPLTRFLSDDAYQDLVASFDETRFMDLLAGRPDGLDAAKDAAGCCGIPVPPGVEKLMPRMLALTITGFMDADTVDLERLGSCCINVPTDDGQLVPFCGYNLTTRSGDYALRRRYRQAAAPGALPVLP